MSKKSLCVPLNFIFYLAFANFISYLTLVWFHMFAIPLIISKPKVDKSSFSSTRQNAICSKGHPISLLNIEDNIILHPCIWIGHVSNCSQYVIERVQHTRIHSFLDLILDGKQNKTKPPKHNLHSSSNIVTRSHMLRGMISKSRNFRFLGHSMDESHLNQQYL